MKMLCVSTWPFKNKFLQLTINGAMGFRDTKCLYLSGTISELYIIGVKKNKKFMKIGTSRAISWKKRLTVAMNKLPL